LVGATNPSLVLALVLDLKLWLVVVVDASDAFTVDVGDGWGAVHAGGCGGGDVDDSVIMLGYSVFSIRVHAFYRPQRTPSRTSIFLW